MNQEDKISGTPEEAAIAFGLNVGTLAIWRHQGKGPRYRKIGRKVLYVFSDVQEWMDNYIVQTQDSIKLG